MYWQDMPDGTGYWAVLRHADVVTVAREPVLFSASAGGVVLEDLDERRLEGMRSMLLAMDPPRHTVYRQPVAPNFKAKVIATLEPRIRQICRQLMRTAAEQGEVEFVHDVTAGLPSRVIGELMGLPGEDLGRIHHWAEQLTTSQDEDYVGAAGNSDEASLEMFTYGMAFAARRRAEEPRPDLTSLILSSDFGGSPMSDDGFGSFFVQLVTAGNDTTKTMLSSGLLCLLEHPDQLARLRAEPSGMPGGGRGDPALRQPPALLPAHGHGRRRARRDADRRRRQGGHVLHVGQPGRDGLRGPAALRHPPAAPTRTCRSGSPSTSAWGCTWPGSRAGSSSRSSSPPSPASSSPPRPSGPARISTTPSRRSPSA